MRVKNRFVRAFNNFVFYVESLEQREQKGSEKWISAGWQVQIKGIKSSPIVLKNYPTNDELAHLASRHR